VTTAGGASGASGGDGGPLARLVGLVACRFLLARDRDLLGGMSRAQERTAGLPAGVNLRFRQLDAADLAATLEAVGVGAQSFER
jgi:hypothetical protein